MKKILMDKIIPSLELNKWLEESIETLERQRSNIDGQIHALEGVRNIFTLDMDANHQ